MIRKAQKEDVKKTMFLLALAMEHFIYKLSGNVTVKEHPVLAGLDPEWPRVLGYNKTILKPEAVEVAEVCGDPFIALGEYGKGRSAAFTTDCAPHWAPPEFCEWKGYDVLFQNLAKWLMREE